MYDEIATLYHLVYPDWNAAIAQQAAALDAIIRKHVGPPPRSILDVSCGIGTQALGLAALGHAVTASDLSSAAVERARREAAQRNLDIDFLVADMRSRRTAARRIQSMTTGTGKTFDYVGCSPPCPKQTADTSHTSANEVGGAFAERDRLVPALHLENPHADVSALIRRPFSRRIM
jgi:SAM-dependent methyltransferase